MYANACSATPSLAVVQEHLAASVLYRISCHYWLRNLTSLVCSVIILAHRQPFIRFRIISKGFSKWSLVYSSKHSGQIRIKFLVLSRFMKCFFFTCNRNPSWRSLCRETYSLNLYWPLCGNNTFLNSAFSFPSSLKQFEFQLVYPRWVIIWQFTFTFVLLKKYAHTHTLLCFRERDRQTDRDK